MGHKRIRDRSLFLNKTSEFTTTERKNIKNKIANSLKDAKYGLCVLKSDEGASGYMFGDAQQLVDIISLISDNLLPKIANLLEKETHASLDNISNDKLKEMLKNLLTKEEGK